MAAPIRDMIRPDTMARLIANGRQQAPLRGTREEVDFEPACRLYLPFSGCVWLLTEVEPGDHDMAFGLCDLGLGFPELGSVWLPELRELRVQGLKVLEDVDWRASKPLSLYAEDARREQRITA